MNTEMLQHYRERLAQKREAEVQLKHLKEDLEARETALTPTGDAYKVLGPNDADRKTVIQQRFADDKPCQDMRSGIRLLELELARVNADIDQFEAARRDEEWQITRQLAEAIMSRSRSNPGREAAQDQGIQEAKAIASIIVGESETVTETQPAAYDIPF